MKYSFLTEFLRPSFGTYGDPVNVIVQGGGGSNTQVVNNVQPTLSDIDRSIAGAAIGGAGGALISKAFLRNVKDIKELITQTDTPEECIEVLKGYAGGITPIALVARKCIKYCQLTPETYKSRCLKLLNTYYATMLTTGTLGGSTGGLFGGLLT